MWFDSVRACVAGWILLYERHFPPTSTHFSVKGRRERHGANFVNVARIYDLNGKSALFVDPVVCPVVCSGAEGEEGREDGRQKKGDPGWIGLQAYARLRVSSVCPGRILLRTAYACTLSRRHTHTHTDAHNHTRTNTPVAPSG